MVDDQHSRFSKLFHQPRPPVKSPARQPRLNQTEMASKPGYLSMPKANGGWDKPSRRSQRDFP
jgi:hypothetical protein